MKAGEELARLEADRVPPGRLVWTTFFFSHFPSEWEERQAFREALREAGFIGIGSDEEVTGDGYWHHWAEVIQVADPSLLREADERAAAVASAHGVRYDEWQLRRNHQTGELYPASPEDADRLQAEDNRSFEIARRAREQQAGRNS